MSKAQDEITIKDLEEKIQQACKDPDLPAWVSLLFMMILAFFKQIVAERDALKRKLYGSPKSERKPKPKTEKKPKPRKPRDPKRHTLDKTELEEEIRVHKAPKNCPKCGKADLIELNTVKESIEYIYKPARLVRVRHQMQKCACQHGCAVVTAPAPPKVGDGGGKFGPGVYADIMVKRAYDAIPFSRQADQWSRFGIPLRKSTICDLFHRGSTELKPIYDALLLELAQSELLNADETPQPFLAEGKTRRGYMWTLADQNLSAYVFSETRSSEVPFQLLKDANGILMTDGYAGYNKVAQLEEWTRVGCMAHARRYFVEAFATAPDESKEIIDLIASLYRIEAEVKRQKLEGTEQHLEIRQQQSQPIILELKAILDRKNPQIPPKSPLGKAINYALKQWEPLTQFLSNSIIPLDNNHAERLLRRVALARKTSMFMSAGRGESYAVILSLVQSCRLCGINPEEYLSDVLLRVQTTPISQVRSLLPTQWQSSTDRISHAWA